MRPSTSDEPSRCSQPLFRKPQTSATEVDENRLEHAGDQRDRDDRAAHHDG
jgi:hypothetical protein